MKILIFVLFILINIVTALKCFNLCNNDITIQICSEKYFKVEQSSLPLFLAIQFESYDKIVFFVNSNIEIIKLKDSLKSINNKIPIFEFPSFDCDFLSNMSPTIDNKTSRIKTLFNLIKGNKMILICSLDSLVEKTVSLDKLIHKELVINKKKILI